MDRSGLDQLARDMVRHLRGSRSQLAFSRQLGYASNVCQTWELGKRYPSLSAFFALAIRARVPLHRSIAQFLQHSVHWSALREPSRPDAVRALLLDLRGDRRINELSEAAGANRATLSRWLKGDGEPRLPELLALVQAATHRLLEFVAIFAPPGQLESTRAAYQDLELQKRLAYELPMSHAVLRALELERYLALDQHVDGFLASLLGITLEEEKRYLSVLARAKQIQKRRGLWRPARVLTVDTRQDKRANQSLKRYWAELGAQRAVTDEHGLYCYNVFSVSEADYRRLCEMHLAYFEELRDIVRRSEPQDRVVVANLQMFALDGAPGAHVAPQPSKTSPAAPPPAAPPAKRGRSR